ncbi:MAG: hypothetical protein MI921_18825 [Cytophagales bacterium]|nr:hypothetical protein [Cytophagales bacterium]
MSKILWALLYLCLFLCLNLRGSHYSFGQVEPDVLSPEKLGISGLSIDTEKNTFLSMLGQPDSIISHIDEFEGTTFYEYVYLNSSFYISNGVFTSFDIRDNSFQFDYGEIEVGDRAENLEPIFPKSYANRERSTTKSTVRVKIGETEAYILFICCHSIITRIMIWEDI